MAKETSELYGEVLAATDKAILIEHDEGENWIPYSLIESHSPEELENMRRREVVTLDVQHWFLKQAGLV